ncbi:MAG: HPP family protein [Candidatus Kapaibacterium sp.]
MPNLTNISEIMVRDLFTVDINSTVKKAHNIMRDENIRHVPVLEGTKLVGMITERKLIEYSIRQLYEFNSNMDEIADNRILDYQDMLVTGFQYLYPEDSVMKAIEKIAKYKTDYLPVVDWDMNLLGVVTPTDLLLYLRKEVLDVGLEKSA